MTQFSARSVTVAFSASVVAKLFLLVSCLMQLSLLSQETFTLAAAQANDSRQRLASLGSIVVVMTSLVVLFVWLYRAKKTLVRAGMHGAEYSPGLTVGGFFIPFANLAIPFLAVRELWKGSKGPANWREQESHPLIAWWWAIWLINAFVPLFGSIVSKLGTGRAMMIATTQWLVVSSVISIVLFFLTILLARCIARQMVRSGASTGGGNSEQALVGPTSIC